MIGKDRQEGKRRLEQVGLPVSVEACLRGSAAIGSRPNRPTGFGAHAALELFRIRISCFRGTCRRRLRFADR